MKLIPLNGKYGIGKFAVVDDEDYSILNTFKWRLSGKDGYPLTSFYIGRYQGKDVTRMYRMHKLVLPLVPFVDHRNGNKLDNKKSNLRPATQRLNSYNRRGGFHVGIYKGVSASRSGRKWRARIYHAGKLLTIGQFATREEAAHAYDRVASKLQGEFARLNFPK